MDKVVIDVHTFPPDRVVTEMFAKAKSDHKNCLEQIDINKHKNIKLFIAIT